MNAVSTQNRGRWAVVGRRALVSGSVASIFSTALLAALGKVKLDRPAAPTNSTSHWLWGDRAYRVHAPTWRHTAVGYLTHHASAIFWAVLCERLLSRAKEASASEVVSAAAATTATAAFVDYVITPRRLTPGFEKHLSTGALVSVFAAIAAGLATGAILNRRLEERTLSRSAAF